MSRPSADAAAGPLRGPLRAALALLVAAVLQACGGALPGLALDGAPPADGTFSSGLCTSAAGRIHAVAAGDPRHPAVLFLHGTPGGWRAFERYLADPALNERLHLVAVDRLGWGASRGAGDDAAQPSFDVHSAALAPLLTSLARGNDGAGVVLVGHSLGASLAPRIAADQRSKVKGMLLLAGSQDPEARARRWYNLLADLPPVRWLISEQLHRANDEIMALPEELRRNAEHWPSLELPLTVIQGEDDPLVSPAHADFVEAVAPQARVLRLPDTNHFIPWNRYELVRSELLALVDQLPPAGQAPLAEAGAPLAPLDGCGTGD